MDHSKAFCSRYFGWIAQGEFNLIKKISTEHHDSEKIKTKSRTFKIKAELKKFFKKKIEKELNDESDFHLRPGTA